MKQSLVISLALLVLVASMGNGLTVAVFKFNQERIEALFCVNKAKPAMHCHGKCHLGKLMAANNDHKNPASPLTSLADAYKIVLFQSLSDYLVPSLDADAELPQPDGYRGLHSLLIVAAIFHPPSLPALYC